jgi:hypothetical protein
MNKLGVFFMRKLLSLIAGLILIPSLAFAAGDTPKKMTDEEYRNYLIKHPINQTYDEDGVSGTISATFLPNSTFKQHVSFKCAQGSGDVDMLGNWSVTNAILHIHVTKMTHSDTHNKDLNKSLDADIAEVMAHPDFDISLADSNIVQSIRPQMRVLSLHR